LNILHTYMWRHMDTTLLNPWQLFIWPKKYWTKGRNWSGKSDQAEEYNTLRCSKPANMAKSDWEPITSAMLKNCYRNLKIPCSFKKKVHHHIHKSLPLASVVSNFNPIDTFTPNFPTFYACRSSKQPHPLGFYNYIFHYARFEVLMVVFVNIQVFCGVPFQLVNSYNLPEIPPTLFQW